MENPKENKRIYSVLAIIIGLIIASLILEMGVRIRAWVKYGSPSTIYHFVNDSASGLSIPKPSSEYGRIRINSLGFRSPEIEDPKTNKTIRFAFLGGSTTFCAEVSSNEDTWPYLVWSNIQGNFPNLKIDYINAGVPGYSTIQSLINLEKRVKQFQPDLIIIYHGINDLKYDAREFAKAKGILVEKSENPSWLAEISLAWYLIEKNIQLEIRKYGVTHDDQLLKFSPSELSKGFKARLTQLIRKSKEVAPLVVVATFSEQYRYGQSQKQQLRAAETSIFYLPFMNVEGLLKTSDAYNEVIRDVAKEEGIILIGEENSIPGDSDHFNDSVHFSDAGSHKMADRVAKGLLAHPQFTQFMEQ